MPAVRRTAGSRVAVDEGYGDPLIDGNWFDTALGLATVWTGSRARALARSTSST